MDKFIGRQRVEQAAEKPGSDWRTTGRGPTERRREGRVEIRDLSPGAIFIADHYEGAGDRLRETTVEEYHSSGITTCTSHPSVIIKDRKFIVLRVYHHHYTCIPLFTYNGQGARSRLDADEHVALHDPRHRARKYEIQTRWKPLRAESMAESAYLLAIDACARMTFPVSRPKNLPVEYLGQLDPESTERFRELYKILNDLADDEDSKARLIAKNIDPAYANPNPSAALPDPYPHRSTIHRPTIDTALANTTISDGDNPKQPALITAPPGSIFSVNPLPSSPWSSTPTPTPTAGAQRRQSIHRMPATPTTRSSFSTRRPSRAQIDWENLGNWRQGGTDPLSRLRSEDESTSKESEEDDSQDASERPKSSSDAWPRKDPWRRSQSGGGGGGGGGGGSGRALKRVAGQSKPDLGKLLSGGATREDGVGGVGGLDGAGGRRSMGSEKRKLSDREGEGVDGQERDGEDREEVRRMSQRKRNKVRKSTD